MGRKRKTRWRRLSIGEVSANEEEEHEKEGESLNLSSKISSGHRHRSGSQPSMLSSSSSSTTPTTPTAMSSAKLTSDPAPAEDGYPNHKDSPAYPSHHNHNHHNNHYNGHSDHYHHHNRHHYPAYNNKDGPPHHHYSSYNKEGGHGSNGTGSPSGHYQGSNGYYSNSYYHHRNSYNNYRNSQYEGSSERGYRGGGGSDYGSGDYHYHSSRYGGGNRFRKPRPYSSNYYYNNGTGQQGAAGADEPPPTNKPSYNQDEYTKITTPRQDVLFKKGYLSQRKSVAQASSVDSTSGPTTPSASTNGTPDTNNSTNGINSDYSEGYENGETDCGVPPYDDTVYYGAPAEAVFTDPNTGQVYYGQCSSNGEYFDAYPVSPMMMTGYPTPVYYHLPYPGMEWNGLPTTMYHPIVAQPQLEEHHHLYTQGSQGECPANGTKGHPESPTTMLMIANGEAGSDESDTPSKPSTLENGSEVASTNGPVVSNGGTVEKKNSAQAGDSSASSTTSSLSSSASTPLSPPANSGVILQQLPASMAALSLNGPPAVHHHAMPHFLTSVPQPSHHGPPPHPFLYHPHPASFVYAPPIYNGVVVPIAPAASTAESSSLEISASSSRKKRKKRRRKKDGQLTDESSDESTESNDVAVNQSPPFSKESSPLNTKPKSRASQPSPVTTSGSATPSSESPSPAKTLAVKKDLVSEEVTKPEERPELNNCQVSICEPESGPVPRETEDGANAKGPEGDSQKPESHPSSPTPEEGSEAIDAAKSETPTVTVEPVSSSSSVKLAKKPADLTVLLEPADLSLLCLQRSPDTLEPSSPDSLNTNQSVAGSEVASVSVSETDFMNRTTSVDEVEEDLPEEEETSVHPCPEAESESEKSPEHKYNASSSSSEMSTLKNPDASVLDSIYQTVSESNDSSPSSTPEKSLEPSPSPEEIFERQLELPEPEPQIESEPETPTEPEIEPETPTEPDSISISRESTLESLNQILPAQNIVEAQAETFEIEIESFEEPATTSESVLTVLAASNESFEESASTSENVSTVLAAPTIVEPPAQTPLLQAEAKEPKDTAETQPEFKLPESSPIRPELTTRPNSITLAVSEWLKTQGDDALTPVAQLQAQFEEAADGDAEDSDSDDDTESLTANDLTQSEQDQKNVQGNPWAVPSSKFGSRLSRKATGLKRLRTTGRAGPPADGTTCSRVAYGSLPNNSKMTTMMKLNQPGAIDEDSGLELSSPESTPCKTSNKSKRRSEEREIDPTSPTSPNSLTFDDGNSAETCDPQKFAKYYQFGVVFEPDQGIDLSLDPVIHSCDEIEDEELGTFDPESLPRGRHLMLENEPERFPDPDDYFDDDDCVQAGIDKTFPHLYVNPLSLAQELVLTTKGSGEAVPESWDVESAEDGLPLYESPPPPVFNSHTPGLNVIRTQIQANGGPMLPRGICCVIQ